MRLVGPMSESQDVTGAVPPELGEPAEEEEFVDAQDSQMNDDLLSPSTTDHSEGQQAEKQIGGVGAPLLNTISKYMRSGKRDKAEDSKVRWHRRIEAALIKLNTEMVALREQIEMQQDALAAANSSILPSFSRQRKKIGLAQSLFNSAVAISAVVVRHVIINAALIALLSLWMHYRGIPAERLESGVMEAMRRLRRLAFWTRLSRTAAGARLPVLPKSLAASNSAGR